MPIPIIYWDNEKEHEQLMASMFVIWNTGRSDILNIPYYEHKINKLKNANPFVSTDVFESMI